MRCRIGLQGLVRDIGIATLLSGLCDCFASRAMTYSLQPAEAGFVCVGAISIARYRAATAILRY